jgi:hypothetical protein
MRSEGQQKSEGEIETALLQLRSAEESERQAGKEALIQRGHRAVEPIMSLLNDLLAHPYDLQYATGYEEEGRKLQRESADQSRPERAGSAEQELARIEITHRLKKDCIELLGQLRAVEAIPTLVMLLRQPDTTVISISVNRFATRPEMKALANIGAPAAETVTSELESVLDARNYPLREIAHTDAQLQSLGNQYQVAGTRD